MATSSISEDSCPSGSASRERPCNLRAGHGSFETDPQHRKNMPAAGHIAYRLNAWLSGWLPEAEAAQVCAHLASCPACEEERRLLEASRSVLRAGPAVDARPWFATKVAARAT